MPILYQVGAEFICNILPLHRMDRFGHSMSINRRTGASTKSLCNSSKKNPVVSAWSLGTVGDLIVLLKARLEVKRYPAHGKDGNALPYIDPSSSAALVPTTTDPSLTSCPQLLPLESVTSVGKDVKY